MIREKVVLYLVIVFRHLLDEKSAQSSRVGSSLSKRFTSPNQQFKSTGIILPAIEGIHEEGMTTENLVYNPRGNTAASSRPLFSNFSTKSLKKNIDHANKLVQNYAGNKNIKSSA